MGIIGMVKIVYYFGAEVVNSSQLSSQKSNLDEALDLLRISLESCEQLPLPLIMLFDELVLTLKSQNLHPSIIERIANYVGDFESKYLSDLDGGQLPSKELHCGLEGELWMNLDGDISPICVNFLPLVSSLLRSAPSLEVLPAHISLLSTIERLTNQGSLLGIDALLGCPLHLPSSKIFSIPSWESLNGNQKRIIILSLYYAVNWIRELLNAFYSQVSDKCNCVSQESKGEITLKLLKRLRNLLFLESLLNDCLKRYPFSLPDLCPLEPISENLLQQKMSYEKGKEFTKHDGSSSQCKGKNKKKISDVSASSKTVGNLKQQTITDVLRKAGVMPIPKVLIDDVSRTCSKGTMVELSGNSQNNIMSPLTLEIPSVAQLLERQRYKFRPLLLECFVRFSSFKAQDSLCLDPAAELPLHLYFLRDLSKKLDYFSLHKKQIAKCTRLPPSLGSTNVTDFINDVRMLFPSLKKNLDLVLCILREETEVYQDQWKEHSAASRNPDVTSILCSTSKVSYCVFKETLCCFGKMVQIPEIHRETLVLTDLLEAFQPTRFPDGFFLGMQHISPGNIDYLYSGAYSFIEETFDAACTISFTLSAEVVLALDAIVLSIRKIVDDDLYEPGKNIPKGRIKELVPLLCKRLASTSKNLLIQKYDSKNIKDDSRNRRELVQRILRIYLENCQSTCDSLDELACLIMPQVTSQKSQAEDSCSFPSLCPATFIAWYRVMHEQNVSTLNRLVKDICKLEKSKAGAKMSDVEHLLDRLQQSVNVVVSLVSMCITHDKAQFELHGEQIVQLLKDLQKATRTIQTLCSDAKGMRRTAITSKVPSTKRSMERFLFHVKALHLKSSGCTFWMGNLKHKNLWGEVVSSQAYADKDEKEEVNEDPAEKTMEDQPQEVVADDLVSD